ncbi:hypothetical protein BSL78_27185 [Apostichopus japonicus]|uniref:Fibronectin type-III domain-containing protein n=1 Tax=Stichopus japonicus TaxID=307972 RepID=A0A2G8JJR5_STIJA|nr:hypothetical protein BSL78_27185 [Apostichopus japonicus]
MFLAVSRRPLQTNSPFSVVEVSGVLNFHQILELLDVFPARLNYPPIPEKKKISVEENDNASSVRIRWLPREPPDPGEVILYVVQGRNHSGENFRRRQMGAWYTLVVTDNQVADIPVDVDPTQPSPPENVKKGRSVLFSTGKVNVVVSWDPPPPGDLELIRYRVFWSKRVEASPIWVGLEEHKKKVAAPATSCELIGLEQNTKYFIQVQSVAKWGRDKKSSERASILIKVEDFTGDDHHKPVSVDRDWVGPSPVEDIQHSSTYWDGDRLMNDISWQKPIVSGNETIERFTIHWRPLQCYNQVDESTMEATVHLMTRFSIYDLVFDCMYLVWVVPVDSSNHLGQAAYNSFRTPSCNEVSITSMPGPICPTIAPDLPSAPQNVSHMFIIGTEISVNISWEVPLNYIQPLTGYRIVWTEYRPHPTNFYRRGFPVLHSSSTVVVQADCKHVILQSLVIGMRYIVTVSATNSIGGGDPAVLDIKTPIVSEPITPTPPTTKPNAHDLSGESVRRTTTRYGEMTTNDAYVVVYESPMSQSDEFIVCDIFGSVTFFGIIYGGLGVIVTCVPPVTLHPVCHMLSKQSFECLAKKSQLSKNI